MSTVVVVHSPHAGECGALRRGRMPSSTAALIRPVLWALGKRTRSGGDLSKPSSRPLAKRGCETVEPPTLDELSTSIPFHYLQAHLYVKRRMYMMSQDPRLLIHAKAIESEIRRRLARSAAAAEDSASSGESGSSSGAI